MADLAAGSEVVLVFGQGGDARHFIGEGRSDFEFAKNHRAGLNAALRCHGMIVEYEFDASRTETKWGAWFRIFS